MALLAENVTRCAICRRTLLVGEAAHIYQDGRTRAIHSVCRLCTTRADRSGWEPMGEQTLGRSARLRVRRDPDAGARPDHPDRLVRRLQADMESLEEEIEDPHPQSAELDRAAEDLRRERELVEALRAELAEAHTRVDELRRLSSLRDDRIRELERALADAQGAQETLLKARRREADGGYLSGIAAEVFNRSPQRRIVEQIAAERGAPVVRLSPEGGGLPRPVMLTFGWGDQRYVFRVTCDLVARLFDVEDLSHGETGAAPEGVSLRPNARFVDGRVVFDS